MRKLTNKAFTLVELLVVITILAIISVVAYQSFG
ncbi:MAG: prepilin-type N-terminal cleavage/methylation domain-containing protein [Candidatus Peribacteria bacterium]|nr:prepilin-type N-terminal cleavage/methylation domain-containing protein [Candidatus Peribacteria bacterium]